jgi:hypothetical protein
MADELDYYRQLLMDDRRETHALAAEARAALAEADGPAVPEGREPASVVGEPSDDELQALADQFWVEETAPFEEEHYAFARAVLARWGHQPAPLPAGEQRHPMPMPVSERLPGAEDCDAEGRCWFFIDGAQWALEDRTYGCNRHRSHWLPAHALPLPAGEVK